MDKTAFKKFLFIILRIYLILFIISIPFLIFFNIIDGIFNGNFSLLNIITTILSAGFGLCLVLGMVLFIGFLICLYNSFIRKNNTIGTKEYYRDIPNSYSPAIVSAILDLNTEITTDYPATISYLCAKKCIEMHEDENGTVSFIALDNSDYYLKEHEQYAFDCLFNGKHFTNHVFKDLVKKDAIKLGLIKEGKRKIHFFRNLGIAIGTYMFLGISFQYIPENTFIYPIVGTLGILSGFSIFAVIFGSIFLAAKYQDENYHRTNLGNKDAKKWSAFKNYLHEYTLISEKDLNYVKILDEYIPYAICLGEGKAIEKFVSTNNMYRSILYKYSDFK